MSKYTIFVALYKYYLPCYSNVKMPKFEAWKVIKLQLRHSTTITFNNNIHIFIQLNTENILAFTENI